MISGNYYFSWFIPADDTSVMQVNMQAKSSGWVALGISKTGRMVSTLSINDTVTEPSQDDTDVLSGWIDPMGTVDVYSRFARNHNTPPIGLPISRACVT
jgi:hypothetical protein